MHEPVTVAAFASMDKIRSAQKVALDRQWSQNWSDRSVLKQTTSLEAIAPGEEQILL